MWFPTHNTARISLRTSRTPAEVVVHHIFSLLIYKYVVKWSGDGQRLFRIYLPNDVSPETLLKYCIRPVYRGCVSLHYISACIKLELLFQLTPKSPINKYFMNYVNWFYVFSVSLCVTNICLSSLPILLHLPHLSALFFLFSHLPCSLCFIYTDSFYFYAYQLIIIHSIFTILCICIHQIIH